MLSLYEGEITGPVISQNMAKIKGAFPTLPREFFTLLSNRIKENGFCDERLNDAVCHVIDNCIYPQPTIAQFISFDKKIRLFNYNEMLEKVNEFGSSAWDMHDKKRINGIVYWYLKTDII